MKKVLITGFEPFGNDSINPSGEVLSYLCDIPEDVLLIKQKLPVEWHKSQEILFDLIDKESPDVIILIGLSAGSDSIRIERVGVNICGSIKDNKGLYSNIDYESREEKIFNDGNDGVFSTLDYNKIYQALISENISVKMSFSAGTYMCNYVLYSALYKVNKEKRNTKVGFIHVPLLPNQREDSIPCMELNQLVKAIELVIKNA